MPVVELSFQQSQMNTEGIVSDILYHPSGEYLITSGFNGIEIHSTPSSKKQHVPSIKCKDSVHGIAINSMGDRVASASENHEVHLIRNYDFESCVAKFTLEARSVAFNPTGSFLACAGEDLTLKVVYVDDPNQVHNLELGGAIRSVAFDTQEQYIAAASCDGFLKIWETSQYKLISTISSIVPRGEYSENWCRIAWSPSGDVLAVPGQNGVKLIQRATWKVIQSLDAHTKPSTIAKFSPNGRYLATTGHDHQILIWDLASKQVIQRYKHFDLICGMAWDPKSDTLAVIDTFGKYALWENPIPSPYPGPHATVVVPDVKKTENAVTASATNKTNNPVEDIGLEDEIAAELEEKDREIAEQAEKMEEEEDDEDMDSDEEAQAFVKHVEAKYNIKPNNNSAKEKKTASTDHGSRGGRMGKRWGAVAEPQSAFQPNATEVGEKKRCYLTFNKVGFITAKDEHTHTTIEIEFHDTLKHRPVKLVDRNHISMGCLNHRGALFGSKSETTFESDHHHHHNEQQQQEEEKKTTTSIVPATITYHPLEGWGGSNSKWSSPLPSDEDIVAMAVTDHYVIVATSNHYLRVWDHSGVQMHVISCLGPIVAMVGGCEDRLAVVYHQGNPSMMDGSQNMGLIVYNLKDSTITRLIGPIAAPITPKSHLKWIGFSPSGIVATCDSQGVVRMLLYKGQEWVPVQTLPANHWIFGVSEKVVNCIVLRNHETTPGFVPRPVPHTVNLSIPLVQPNLDTSKIEENHLRERLMIQHREECGPEEFAPTTKEKLALDAYVMKLVETAMKAEKSEKAYNLSNLILFEKPFTLLLNMVSQRNNRTLTDKMNELLHQKFRQQKEEDDEEEQSVPALVKPSSSVAKTTTTTANNNIKPVVAAAKSVVVKQEKEDTMEIEDDEEEEEPAAPMDNDIYDYDDDQDDDHESKQQQKSPSPVKTKSKKSIKAERENDKNISNSPKDNNVAGGKKKKANRFAVANKSTKSATPNATSSGGNLFNRLSKMQEGSKVNPTQKKRKLL